MPLLALQMPHTPLQSLHTSIDKFHPLTIHGQQRPLGPRKLNIPHGSIRRAQRQPFKPSLTRRPPPERRREHTQPRLEARIHFPQIRRLRRKPPPRARRPRKLQPGRVESERSRGARGPAMRMRQARRVGVGCIAQRAVGRVALDKGGIGHARIIQHEVAPLSAHEGEGGVRVAGEEVRLDLEAADEGGDGRAGFRGGSAVGSPAGAEGGGDPGALGAGEGEVGFDGPGVAVLGV